MLSSQEPVRYQQYEFHKWKSFDAHTIVEAPVSLTVNGQAWLTFMCTPVDLEAMAIGFLFNEAIISGMDEVADVRLCEHGDNVDVWLNRSVDQPASWRRTSGCTGGVTAVDALARLEVAFDPNLPRLAPAVIEKVVEILFESQDLYRQTGGVHTSALSDGENLILSAEDIGRHNTLDKIAGLCLINAVWPATRILISTGRISSEMLQKAARLGAPVVISRTSPSSLSIQMAERYGITLIGYARRNRFNVYTNAQRIENGSGN
jgi:FdhD protein